MRRLLILCLGLLCGVGSFLYSHTATVGLSHYLTAQTLPLKSMINISYPNGNTIWMSPGQVELQWTTKNISANKTIKFYLSKDDVVVQELGIFENNGFAGEVALDHGLQEGDNYRVIGIELFPQDKYSIAKFATPFFTVKKMPRPKKVLTAMSVKTPTVRKSFDGRILKYVNEMSVSSKTISISIWDHSRKDGDVVSIYLNGEAVVSKYSLEYYKKKVELTLDPNKPNDLFLYAHNLGKYPPNTVSIEITDGSALETLILNSDLKSCEAVLITVEE